MNGPKQARKDAGLTMAQLYDKHHIAPNFVSMIETGKQQAYEGTRQKLEEAYGQRINWLDVPIQVKNTEGITVYECERVFRSLLNFLNGVPEVDRKVFIETAIKQLRTVFEVY